MGIAVANLGWTLLQRHAGDLRMERAIQARRHRRDGSAQTESSTGVKITQFYATSGEITDAEHNTICYGVENAKTVRLEPPVENLTPALTRCIWVEPRQDTTYTLIAEGLDGSVDSASFPVHVKPAPPSIVFMAVSHEGDCPRRRRHCLLRSESRHLRSTPAARLGPGPRGPELRPLLPSRQHEVHLGGFGSGGHEGHGPFPGEGGAHHEFSRKPILMVGPEGFEPSTNGL